MNLKPPVQFEEALPLMRHGHTFQPEGHMGVCYHFKNQTLMQTVYDKDTLMERYSRECKEMTTYLFLKGWVEVFIKMKPAGVGEI